MFNQVQDLPEDPAPPAPLIDYNEQLETGQQSHAKEPKQTLCFNAQSDTTIYVITWAPPLTFCDA